MKITPRRSPRRMALVAALVPTLGLLACGGDDATPATTLPATTAVPETAPPETAAPETAAPTTEPPATEAPDTEPPTTDVPEESEMLLITGVDYGYEGLPDSVAVGTRLEFTNVSSEEVHEIVLLRVVDGEERSLDELLMLPDEETDALTDMVGVNVAYPLEDGTNVLGDLVFETPGRYILLCAIPQGADPAAFRDAVENGPPGPPDVPGGPPHLVYGMIAEVMVS